MLKQIPVPFQKKKKKVLYGQRERELAKLKILVRFHFSQKLYKNLCECVTLGHFEGETLQNVNKLV